MSHPWIDAVAAAVAAGETKFQFAVPAGTYPGDLFFITEADHSIILALWWDGVRWHSEHEVLQVQDTRPLP